MRLVSLDELRVGMKVGQAVFSTTGGMYIAAGLILNEKYIENLRRNDTLSGLYIDDDISEGIEPNNIIDEKLRVETVKEIKNVFSNVSKGSFSVNTAAMKKQIDSIIEDIINNKGCMANLTDLKIFDDYTYFHSVNVAVLAVVIGVELGLDRDKLFKLGFGALLHDIGKVFIDKEVLNKKGKLTDEEFVYMKTHSIRGFELMREKYKHDVPITSYITALDHHEKWDGSGYPNAKSKNDISLNGRIAAIADVYDALTSDRPYRKGMLPSEAMEYMMGCCGTHFDPQIVPIFIRKVAPYPVGTCVVLSNGYTALVVENFESFGMRPKVRIFKKGDERLPEMFEVNLMSEKTWMNVTIVEVARL